MAASDGPSIITDGLVFAVDAADRNRYTSGSNTWYDWSGNGNNGTLTNGPTFDEANGGSIVFDGTDDYVNVPHSPDHSFTSDFSIGAVTYFNDNTANCIIQKGSGNDYYQEYWLLQDMRGSSRNIAFIMGRSGNTSANYIRANGVIISNSFSFINVVVEGTTASIFLNGELKSSDTIFTRIQSTADLRIGWRVDGFAPASGKIPFVHIYNRALTASEITQNYNALKSRFNL